MKPNVLFILVDSFSSDKCHGPKKTSITPHLDSLISNGAYFSQAITSAPVTIPSVSSILTGSYPFESCTLDNNLFNLNPNVRNYVDHMIDNGYEPYAVLPEGVSHTRLPKVFKNNVDTYNSLTTLYDGIGQKIIDKLESKTMKEPWIYYIQLQDIHGQAVFHLSKGPQEFYDEKYGINQYERMISVMDVWFGKILGKIDLKNTLFVLTADHGSEVSMFDTELEKQNQLHYTLKEYKRGLSFKIAHRIITKFPNFLMPLRKKLSTVYVDRRNKVISNRIKPELEKLEKQNLKPHEKRILKDSILLDPQTYDGRFIVPLLFSGYGILSAPIISQQVRTIDIFPTIMEIIDLETKNSQKHGQSLLPLINGDTLDEIPAYVDSAANPTDSTRSDVIGIRTSSYKYFRNRKDSSKNVNLHDLKKDPLEENNIANENPDIIKEMEERLTQIKHDKDFNYKTLKELTDEEVRKAKEILLKLGYV